MGEIQKLVKLDFEKSFDTQILRRNVPLFFLIQIGVATTVNLIWTIWPLFVQELGANVFEVSLVWSIGGLVTVASMFTLAGYVDRIGRRRSVMLSVFFTILPTFIYTYATNWQQLIPTRVIYAFFWSLYQPTRMAMIADITEPASRGRTYGIVEFAWAIGSIFSPFVGSHIVDNYGWNVDFYTIIIVAALTLVPAYFLVETSPSTAKKGNENSKMTKWQASKTSKRSVFLFAFAYTLIVMGRMGFSQIIPFYLENQYEASKVQINFFFSVGIMVMWLLTMIPAGVIADKFERGKVMLGCYAVIPFLFLFWPLMPNFNSLLSLFMVINGLDLLAVPASMAFMMDFVDDSGRGFASSCYMAGGMLGLWVTGPLLSGFLYENFGPETPFHFSAIFYVVAIMFILHLRRRWKIGRALQDNPAAV